MVVVTLWAPFGLRKAVGIYEEYGIYQQPSNLISRISLPDPTRPYTEAPFIFAAVLTPNSFVGFNLFMMILFLGKGVAVYKLLRYLVPENRALPLITAVLYIMYPADIGLMTFRAINIHTAIFLGLFAVERLVSYWKSGNKWNWPLIWAIQVSALGIYEISYVIIGLAPLLLFWIQKSISRQLVFTTVLWFVMPLAMGLKAVWKLKHGDSNYVVQTLDSSNGKGLDISTLSKSLELMYVRHYRSWIHALHQVELSSHYFIYAAIGAVLVGIIVWAHWSGGQGQPTQLPWKKAAWLFIGGLAFMSLSFAPYLASPYREWNFRTFYLTALGAAIVIAVSIVFIGQYLRRFGGPVSSVVTSFLVLLALTNALNQQAFFVEASSSVQRLLAGIVEQAPAIQEGSTLVFVDEFNDYQDQWHFAGTSLYFERALRFLYDSDTLVVRLCTLHVDRPMRYCNFYPDKITHVWRGVDELETFYYADIMVMHMNAHGKIEIVDTIPNGWVDPSDGEDLISSYNPRSHLVPNAPLPARVDTFFSCWPLDQCLPPLDWLSLQSEVLINFDQPIRGIGWESYRNGIAQMWTTNKTASLFLQLVPESNYTVQFTIINSIAPDVVDSLTLNVNQVPILLERSQDAYGRFVFTGVIPKNVIELDAVVTRLDFNTNQVLTPVSLGLGADVRTLGVLFDRLEISPISSQVRLDFDAPITGTGWWEPEDSKAWTRNRESTIYLYISTDQDLVLEFGVAYYVVSDILDSLKVKVNGEPIALERQQNPDGIYVYRGIIPKAALALGDANKPILTFEVNRVVQPVSLGINADERELGLLFDWLEVWTKSEEGSQNGP